MRQLYNVLVLPYRIIGDNAEFCIFQRSDETWQFVAGGGENMETPIETACRELAEETGITASNLFELDTKGHVPVDMFKDFEKKWKENIYVVPVHTFCADVGSSEIYIGSEHQQYQWTDYEKALAKLKYDLDKTALWELSKRIEMEAFN